MRAVLGLLLIMLGLAMAVVWMPENDGHRQLAVVTEIATQGLPRPSTQRATETGAAVDRNARTFSPQTPLMARVEPASTVPAHTAAVARLATPSPAPVATVATFGQGHSTGTPAPGQAAVLQSASVVSGSMLSSASSPSTQSSLDPAAARSGAQPALSREELIRSLQRELKRVGCYHGEIDGSWGAGSRRAMGVFTDRVNASLPLEQPDFVLLALLRNHAGTACGRDCPNGQTLADNGRCLPNAVVARAGRGTERARPTRGDEQVAAAAEPPATGRWTTRVQAEAASTSAMTPLATATAGAVIATAPAIAPLPGRMAMGGPQSGAGAFVPPPVAAPQARDAVRGVDLEADTADPTRPVGAGKRSRSSRAELRRQPWNGGALPPYAYRYPVPSASVYRAQRPIAAPRYYASAPRRSTRNWTATFFSNH